MGNGRASQHRRHLENVKKAKRNNPEEYRQYLEADRRKYAAAKEQSQTPEEHKKLIKVVALEVRKLTATRKYAAYIRSAIPQLGKGLFDPEQILSNAETTEIMTKISEECRVSLFKLLRAAELGPGYNPNGFVITNLINSITDETKNHALTLQLIRYCIAAEAQCVINDGVRKEERVKTALKPLREHKRVPLISDLNFDTAYTLWSWVGSWLGAMVIAGLNPSVMKVNNKKDILRYKAKHASPDLLPVHISERLTPETMERLKLICETANQAERMLYDYEIPDGTLEIFKESGYTPQGLLSNVGLSVSSRKAPTE